MPYKRRNRTQLEAELEELAPQIATTLFAETELDELQELAKSIVFAAKCREKADRLRSLRNGENNGVDV